MPLHDPPATLRSSFSDESLYDKASSVHAGSPPPPDSSCSRISVLPAAMVPYLRRLDIGDHSAPSLASKSHGKHPLLTLTLSSPSFLDSTLSDDTGHALYRITTRARATSIARADWHSSTRIGDLKWPLRPPAKGKERESDGGVHVQVRGEHWKLSTHILRPGKYHNSPQKFHVPGYPRALKWRQVGSSYWCISPSVKGPIATYAPSSNASPARLEVFETFYDKYETSPSPVGTHRSVSTVLLDYLVITALLLVTDVQEWMLVKTLEGPSPMSPVSSLEHDIDSPALPPMSASSIQLRKILYGEAIFPKQTTRQKHSHPYANGGSYPPSPELIPRRLARSVSSSSVLAPSGFVDDEHEDDEDADEDEPEEDEDEDIEPVVSAVRAPLTPSLPPSPSADSAFFSMTPALAPSHTYIDPSFYSTSPDKDDVPPVPAIPAQYSSVSSRSSAASQSPMAAPSPTTTSSSLGSGSAGASAGAGTRRVARELPKPPPTPSSTESPHSWTARTPPRSQSTPPKEHHPRYSSTLPPEFGGATSSGGYNTYTAIYGGPPHHSASLHHARRHSAARSIGSGGGGEQQRRQLPTPPSVLPNSSGQSGSDWAPSGSGSLAGSNSSASRHSQHGGSALAASSSAGSRAGRGREKRLLTASSYGYAYGASGVGRSLPPTPIVPKDPDATRQSIFDMPPPAYNTIDFSERPVSGTSASTATAATSVAASAASAGSSSAS